MCYISLTGCSSSSSSNVNYIYLLILFRLIRSLELSNYFH